MDFEKLSKTKIKKSKGFQRKLWSTFLSDLRDRHTQLFKRGKPPKLRKNMNNQNQKPLSDDELKEVLEEIRR